LSAYWRGFLLASKIAPCFIGEEGGAIQVPQEVSFACPYRVFEGLQRDAVDQVLQAVKFTEKNASGLCLALDKEFQAANCFTELIRGYTMGAVEPYMMDLHLRERADFLLLPLFRFVCLCFFALSLGATSHFAPTGCGSVGALLPRWGSISRGLLICMPAFLVRLCVKNVNPSTPLVYPNQRFR